MKQTPRLLRALVGIAVLFSVSSCGGDGSSSGGGGTTPGVASPTATVVSGTVTAPGGAVAFFKQPSLGDLFVSEAYAALTGLVNVSDNTIVQLARLNVTGSAFTILSTTPTSGGRYSFNLTALDLQPSNDLIVRVAGASGTQMRAFVVGTVADLSPVSEAAYQLAIQSLNGNPLSNLTLQEVANISGAIGLISMLQNIGNATSVDQAVGLVRSAINSSAQVTGFIAAAAAVGPTTLGTGDIGNFFPFGQGNVWLYQAARTSTFQTPLSYQTTRTITGQEPAPIYGVSSTVISDSNDEGENRVENSYHVKGMTGITSYGNDDPNDDIERALSPYKTIHFPLGGGETTVIEDREGLNWGDDLDGDNRNELFRATLLQTVLGVEDITVPAGTFRNCLKIQRKAIFVVSFTTGGSVTLLQSDTSWLASGLGTVRSVSLAEIEGTSATSTLTEELTFYSVDGQTGGTGGPQPPPPPPTPTRIEISPPTGSGTAIFLNQSKQIQAIAYGPNNIQFPGLTYTWQSTDSSVVEVDTNGIITGRIPGIATISATSSGLTSNSITFRVNNGMLLSLATNDIVYDNVSQKIYASIRSDSPSNPNTITAIDPVTGNIGPYIPVGVQPNKLAVSQDGQLLYVGLDGTGAVRRLQLPGLVPGSTFSLGTGTPIGCTTAPLLVDDMDVLPGLPQSIAIARKYAGGCSPWHFGIAIYDSGIQRQNVTPPFQPNGTLANIVEFSGSAGTLYGLDGESDGSLFTTIALDSSGASITTQTERRFSSLGIRKDMVFEGGRIYTNDGEIFDPVTHTSLGKFTSPDPNTVLSSVRPDPLRNRVFFIGRNFTQGALHLIVYDKTTLQLMGTEEIDLANDGGACQSGLSARTGLLRWGIDGIAFRTVGCHVVLLRSTLIQ